VSGRPVITEADVREAARGGRTLNVAANAVITPAARDAAEQLGISLAFAGPSATAAADASTPAPSTQHPAPRIIVIGADHGGFPLKEQMKVLLTELGCDVMDVGTHSTDPVDYPDFAIAVAQAVAEGRAECGIMVDGAGIGSSMAANKVPGVRAALCYDLTTAQNAREHNDANVLTLGGTLIGTRLAFEIVRAFLGTAFAGGRHASRVDKINRLDGARGQTR
jgi:ribose 5-phosphate isomerase B